MQAYIKKMITERDDLKGKVSRAKKVIENPPFDSDAEGLKLLSLQVSHMEKYLEVLEQRIKYEEVKK
jgi:hypothetical protein